MKSKVFISTAVLTFFFIGCSDDEFLEKPPLDQLNSSTFWRTEKDAVLAINAAYDPIQETHLAGQFLFFSAEMADDAQTHRGGWRDIGRIVATPVSARVVNIWGNLYRGIYRTNEVVDNLPGMDIEESLKSRILAEARFLRAFYYHYLIILWGDVPLITSVMTEEEYRSTPRAPKNEVAEQIIQDLQFAEANLPDTYSGSDVGRATRGAAMAYLAQEYLYQGRWTEAAAKAKQIIDGGLYALNPSYPDIFTVEGENGIESLFEAQFKALSDGEGYPLNDDFAPRINIGAPRAGRGFMRPLQNFVDEFETVDGYLITDTASMFDPDDPFANRDPRMDYTILHEGSEIFGATFTANRSLTGYCHRKYVLGAHPENQDNDCGLNVQLMRYADVLLMYAEAQNEAAGPDASVYDAVDQVRNRVDMPNLSSGFNQADMRNWIRHERRVEFGFEGKRFFDVLRWGIGEEVITKKRQDPGEIDILGSPDAFPYNSNYELWPIPQVDIDASKNLSQNPGY